MNLSNKVYKILVKLSFLNIKYHKKVEKFIVYIILISKITTPAGDYCEGVIPDPIPNSEVKPFCADGTLS